MSGRSSPGSATTSAAAGRLPGNWVHIGVALGGRWWHYRQNKHHRWSLDEGQVLQYHLGGALHPRLRWWEAMEVPRRSIQFLELGGGITIVAVVCEDLARLDTVADLLRTVGPTLVLTVLLDGPQLASRWTARYASVLADDPGSAVLTLTSFGMVERSRPGGHAPSRVVALWKDPARGIREIPLEPGAHGVLLSACVDRATRHSADGRWPADNTTHLRDVGVHQVRAASEATGPATAPASEPSDPPGGTDLDERELTVLASWAEALVEAGTAEVDAVVADAAGTATWRADFGLEPRRPHWPPRCDALAAAHGSPDGGQTSDDGVRAAGPPRACARPATPDDERLTRLVSVTGVDVAAIDDAIAALEAQRKVLGDAVVDTALRPLLAQRAGLVDRAVAEQRKLVTVLFSDLVDFTVLSQQLDAEDVRTVIDAYFLRWQEHIEANGGVVEKFIGDAVMAVFGMHKAAEEDPHRAIRAALAMRSSLDDLNAEVAATHGITLEMRVGIDTGEVVVSTLGDRPGQEFVVVGDIVNRASRLQSAAPARRHPHLRRHVSPRPGLVRRAARERPPAEGDRRTGRRLPDPGRAPARVPPRRRPRGRRRRHPHRRARPRAAPAAGPLRRGRRGAPVAGGDDRR